MLSNVCKIEIKVVICIARQTMISGKVKTGDLVAQFNMPEVNPPQVPGLLTKHSIITSSTGSNGGLHTGVKQMKTIYLPDIANATTATFLSTIVALAWENATMSKLAICASIL